MSMEQHAPHESIERGHEPIETDVRAVWRTAAVITAVVLGAFLLIVGMMKWLSRVDGSPASGDAAKPNLEWAQQSSLQALRDEEWKLLNEYKWADQNAGVARIPVDRGMEIISQNGLPARLQGPSASDFNSAQQPAEAGVSPENPAINER
jgi:hypothetical protein